MRYRFVATLRATWTWTRRLAFVAAGVWIGQAAHVFWITSPWLRIARVDMDPGMPVGFARDVEIYPDDHLIGFSAEKTAVRLERNFPELSDVRIRRHMNRSVSVHVQWREPVARIDHQKTWWGMDRSGVIFPLVRRAGELESKSRVPPEELTILSGVGEGPEAVPAVEFLEAAKKTQTPWVETLWKLKVTPAREAVLYIGENTPVFWGEMINDPVLLKMKSQRLQRILDHAVVSRGAQHLRFITDDRVVVKPLEPSPDETGKNKR